MTDVQNWIHERVAPGENLSREQILGLANMFHQVRPEEVVSESLPGRDRMLDGISYLEPIEGRQKILVDWLLRGEETAANRLTTVRVLNGCRSRRTTAWVAQQLQDQEFHVIFAGRTTEGAGNPARLRSTIATSLDHGSLSALVIIATQTRP